MAENSSCLRGSMSIIKCMAKVVNLYFRDGILYNQKKRSALMKASSNPKLRILYLMHIFLKETDEDHTLTVNRIIEKLALCGIEAERRTIYDDIETLRLFGLDIIMRKSKTYDYFVGERDFELPELKLLVDAVQCSKFITYKKSEELIKKITALAGDFQAKELKRDVYMLDRVKSMNEAIYFNVDNIHTAINANRKLKFKYAEYKIDKVLHLKRGGEEYVVDPYMLTWFEDNYYMVAHHERYGGLTHFRVDKMIQSRVGDEARAPLHADIKPSDYVKRTFGMVAGDEKNVEVRFEDSLIGVVIDRFGKDIFIVDEHDGHFRAVLRVAVSNSFLAWIFQFGSRAAVLGPEDVAAKMKALLEEAAARYTDKA